MLRVALTGGIAAGKSVVTTRFQALGAPVIDADVLAREVVAPGTEGLEAVVAALGDWVVAADGRLDRGAVRAHVVADDTARRRLEAITHPRIRRRMSADLDELADAGHPYAISVVPLLVETDQTGTHDRTLVVDAPEATQVARLQQRDRCSADEARRWLANQVSRWQRLQSAQDVVTNADDLPPDTTVMPQVASLDRKYRLLAAGSR